MDWVYNIGLYSIPAFALLLGVEIIGDRLERRREEKANFHVGRRRAGFSTRDTLSSLSVYGLLRIVKPLNDLIRLPAIVIAATLAPWTLPATQWWVWVMAIVGADFAYYIEHRMQHRIRLFWAAHSVHHSSEHFNMSTAVRLPWLLPGAMLTSVVYAPLALIGIPAWLVFLSHSIVLLFQYPLHTELVGRLPRAWEYVFNTPSHHRVHHGANNPYLDKNFGGILIIWDRLLGTYAEETEQVRYGLTHNIATFNPIKVNYHEYAALCVDVWKAPTWRVRVNYLARPPGWVPVSPSTADERAPAVPEKPEHVS